MSIFLSVLKEQIVTNERHERRKIVKHTTVRQEFRHFTDNEGTRHRLSALRSGNGQKRILFLHGTPAHARKWQWYLKNTPADFEFIAADRPGFGLNHPKHSGFNLHHQSALLSRWLDESTVIVGHSFGGPTAVRMAIDYPDRVKGLILIGASLSADLEPRHRLQGLGASWLGKILLPRALYNSNDELLRLHEGLRQQEPDLHKVKVPTLIIHNRDDNLSCFQNVTFMKERMNGVSVMHTQCNDTGGHFIPWTQSEDILGHITKFYQHCD